MLTFRGLACAEAGPTAAPTATVLITSAAATAIRVRVNCDCDDIGTLLFSPAFFSDGPMPFPNQGACQSRKTAKNDEPSGRIAHFATKTWRITPTWNWE